MRKPINFLFAVVLCVAQTLFARDSVTAESLRPLNPRSVPQFATPMDEYRGVKLGMNRQQVKTMMGQTARAGVDWEEFNLGGSDLMTVRYDGRGLARMIQLYFTIPTHAPKWAEVIGDAEIHKELSGSKHARAASKEDNFWVTMFQSKTGAVTTITISR